MYHKYLEDILAHKHKLNQDKKTVYLSIQDKLKSTDYTKYSVFKKQLASLEKGIHIIAEIKKASPSQGLIRQEFDLLAIARAYERAGVCAVSVLTEDKFFLGDPHYVKKVSEEIHLPVLAKDFFLCEGQVYEARFHGASAILLIMSILKDGEVKSLMALAHDLDMDCLVEVHDRQELERALDCGAEMLGINNRNLKTFEVDLNVSRELIPLIPKDKVIVVESGIQAREEAEMFKSLGANALLIGESLMREKDIVRKLNELKS